MTYLVRQIPSLAIIIVLERIQYHDRPDSGLKRVCVDSGYLKWTKDADRTVILGQPENMFNRFSAQPPSFTHCVSGSSRFGCLVSRRERWDMRSWHFDMSLKNGDGIVHHPTIGGRLVADQLRSGT
jgi:hypothetical protein